MLLGPKIVMKWRGCYQSGNTKRLSLIVLTLTAGILPRNSLQNYQITKLKLCNTETSIPHYQTVQQKHLSLERTTKEFSPCP
jgi:hypothetical protein